MGKPPPLAVRLEEALPFQRLIGEANRGFSHHGPAKAMRRRNHIKREWQNRSHVRWYCRYPIVIVPKYRQKAIFGTLRQDIGKILRELCDQMGIELIAGQMMPDHVHLCSSIPPKYSVANAIGRLKGKSAIRMHREYLGRVRNFTELHFWARGYCVSMVGLDEAVIRQYIRNQGQRAEQLALGDITTRRSR